MMERTEERLCENLEPEGYMHGRNISCAYAASVNFSAFVMPEAAEFPLVENLRDAFPKASQHAFAFHRHDYFEIFVITAGYAKVWFDLREHQLSPPCVCILPPGEVHAWKPDVAVDGYVLRVPSSAVSSSSPSEHSHSSIAAITGAVARPLSPAELKRIASLARWLRDEVTHARGIQCEIIRAQVQLLFLELWRLTECVKNDTLDVGNRMLYQRFMELIDAHYRDHWTVPEYAARLRVGRVRLARVTQQLAGKSPALLIHERLMAEAKRLVVYTDLQIGQVAETLGFPTQAYFCRAFRQATGTSPSKFRLRAR